MRIFVCEAVYDRMVEIGLDDESEVFEDILNAIVQHVCERRAYGMTEKTPVDFGVSRKWHKIKARYPEGECREPWPNEQEIFMGWKLAVVAQLGDDWKLWELLGELEATARKAKEEWESEDGISVGEGAGTGAESADGSEPTGDEDGTCNGVADWGRAGTEAGAVEEECLDHGEEDEETETDRILRALAFGPESECRGEMGIPWEGSGEAPDETGCVEGRKTCFGSLPPMSEHRTSLYAKGVFR